MVNPAIGGLSHPTKNSTGLITKVMTDKMRTVKAQPRLPSEYFLTNILPARLPRHAPGVTMIPERWKKKWYRVRFNWTKEHLLTSNLLDNRSHNNNNQKRFSPYKWIMKVSLRGHSLSIFFFKIDQYSDLNCILLTIKINFTAWALHLLALGRLGAIRHTLCVFNSIHISNVFLLFCIFIY